MKADRWILRVILFEGGREWGDNNFVAETTLQISSDNSFSFPKVVLFALKRKSILCSSVSGIYLIFFMR